MSASPVRFAGGPAVLPTITPTDPKQLRAMRVETIMRQVSDVRADVARLAHEEELLQQELRATQQETSRVTHLAEEAENELQTSNAAVQELLRWREEQESAVAAKGYDQLEMLITGNKALELEIDALEAELEGTLTEARALQEQSRASTIETTGDSSYLRELGKMIEEQERMRRERELHEEELKTNDEASKKNAARIQQLRGELERIGADIPEAPMTHRTKQLMARRNRVSGLPDTISAAQAAATSRELTTGSPNRSALSASHSTREIALPLGVLRPLTEKLGPLRTFAANKGVQQFAVTIESGRTLVRAAGPSARLDEFEHALHDAVEKTLNVEGVLTYKDKGRALGYDEAAAKVASLVLTEPIEGSSSVPAFAPPLPPASAAAALAITAGGAAEDDDVPPPPPPDLAPLSIIKGDDTSMFSHGNA